MKKLYFELLSPSNNCGKVYEIDEILESVKSPYQQIDFYKTKDYGVLFTLDNIIQLTEKEEFFYHEMIVHPAAFTHKNPRNVLIIGGGDCGTLTHVLKHKNVEKVDMVEIDEMVVKLSQKYLPHLTKSLSDKRANLIIDDGFAFLKNKKNCYDLIIIDSTDPETIAKDLFSGDFYQSVYDALTEDGISIYQSEPPYHPSYDDMQKRVYKTLKTIYKYINFVFFPEPMYPTGYFTVLMASKRYNPLEVDKILIKEKIKDFNLMYYNEDIHYAALAIPEFMKKKLNI
ncbi:MAG: polyamine aminopropyltransferase [Spirochaetes bacterium]|nr:polyamine aminopropyltransferase [Spirochaetota bacterium]